jgi:hypothetical protein
MNEQTKNALIIVGAIVAVGAAIFVGANTLGGSGLPQEKVVGTIDMGPGGGRDAESGQTTAAPAADPNAAADPSGMPADMVDGVKDGK